MLLGIDTAARRIWSVKLGLPLREIVRDVVDGVDQVHCFLPGDEVFVMLCHRETAYSETLGTRYSQLDISRYVECALRRRL